MGPSDMTYTDRQNSIVTQDSINSGPNGSRPAPAHPPPKFIISGPGPPRNSEKMSFFRHSCTSAVPSATPKKFFFYFIILIPEVFRGFQGRWPRIRHPFFQPEACVAWYKALLPGLWLMVYDILHFQLYSFLAISNLIGRLNSRRDNKILEKFW